MLKCYQMMNLVKRKIVSQLNYITSKPYYLTSNLLRNPNCSSVNKYYSSINNNKDSESTGEKSE